MRAIVVASIGLSMIVACGSDASPATASSSASSSSTSGGGSSGAGSSSGGAGSSSGAPQGDASSSSSSGATATCTAIYCCNFDGAAATCEVDDANVHTATIDPAWLVQGAMRLEVQGMQDVVNGLGLLLSPKTTSGKRVSITFTLRMETSVTAGVLVAKGAMATASRSSRRAPTSPSPTRARSSSARCRRTAPRRSRSSSISRRTNTARA